MKSLMLALVFFICSVNLFSQNGQLYGEITDVATGKPLVGANIYLQNTQKGSATIKDGKFIVTKIPPGNYDAVSSYFGYKTVLVKDVKIESGKKIQLDIALPRDHEFRIPEKMEKFYLKQLPEDIISQLNKIKEINKEEYYRMLQSAYFQTLVNKSEKRSEINETILKLELNKSLYALQYKTAEESEKDSIKKTLNELLLNLYQKKTEKREAEIHLAKQKIDELLDAIKLNKKEKDKFIQQELNRLLKSEGE